MGNLGSKTGLFCISALASYFRSTSVNPSSAARSLEWISNQRFLTSVNNLSCLGIRYFLTNNPSGASVSPKSACNICSGLAGGQVQLRRVHRGVPAFLVVQQRPPPIRPPTPGLLVRQQPAKPPRGHTWSRLMWHSQLFVVAQPASHQLWLDVRGRPARPEGAPGRISRLRHVLYTDKWAELCSSTKSDFIKRLWKSLSLWSVSATRRRSEGRQIWRAAETRKERSCVCERHKNGVKLVDKIWNVRRNKWSLKAGVRYHCLIIAAILFQLLCLLSLFTFMWHNSLLLLDIQTASSGLWFLFHAARLDAL